MNDLDHRSQAIGGTGRRRQQVVAFGFIKIIIDTHDDIQGIVLYWGGDNDLFNAVLELHLQSSGIAELASAFQNNLNAFGGPVNRPRLGARAISYDVTIDP